MATINGPDVRCQECGRWEDDYKADLARVTAERATSVWLTMGERPESPK